ncbi:T6SS immunity protein Tli3 family protein [Proteus terrae]|uniref:T6SS immunity protein Tli3 family protein n=2 Tax=Proteus terrae TaxID=1574161 RepID=UPI001330011E|nr:hypothetical protein [Proteus terrae]QKD68626.1 hypothetical protein HG541_04125 [Proteus terrae subsp. cibarius]QKD73800.1 hypothetical protein HG539_13530 [Proteus terrae subsp. cibarius]UDF25096.1 hypothetical protein LHA39_13345 [Proteus terrae subsp. cibarius]WCG85870.1 hypothetical protein ONR71_13215 [Proteus terrae]
MFVKLLKLPFIVIISTTLLSGCLSLKEKAAIKAEQDKIEQQRQLEELRKTFKPPVVIYRIDDHRFFTLEEFNEKREGYTFYNNTQTQAHFKVYNGSACNFRGRLIWAAQSDEYIAFPAVDSNWEGCAGRRDACQSSILMYKQGKSVSFVLPFGSQTLNPVNEIKRFTLVVTDTHFYIGRSFSSSPQKDPLDNLSWDKYSYPTPEELKNKTWQLDVREAPPYEIKTPSGQTQFDCSDPSISPMSKLGDYGRDYKIKK